MVQRGSLSYGITTKLDAKGIDEFLKKLDRVDAKLKTLRGGSLSKGLGASLSKEIKQIEAASKRLNRTKEVQAKRDYQAMVLKRKRRKAKAKEAQKLEKEQKQLSEKAALAVTKAEKEKVEKAKKSIEETRKQFQKDQKDRERASAAEARKQEKNASDFARYKAQLARQEERDTETIRKENLRGFNQRQKLREREALSKQKDLQNFSRYKAQLAQQEEKEAQKAALIQVRRDAQAQRFRRKRAQALKRERAAAAKAAEKAALIQVQRDAQAQRLRRKRRQQQEREARARGRGRGRAAFPLQRVVAGAALFTGLRLARQATVGLVTEAVQFNRVLETSQASLTGLLAQSLELTDSFGKRLDVQEKLGAAGNIAREQLEALRKDSRRTVASLTDLVTTFQTNLSLGLRAGLDVGEVRQFTVAISQAANALGLPQNQLAEEVRSLLQGTINPRNTRIAVALGITNQQIRQAREQGQLFEFLSNQLEAFGAIAEEQANTLNGRLLRFRQTLQELIGLSGSGFTDKLSANLGKALNALLTEDFELNPRALQVLEPIFASLNRIQDKLVDTLPVSSFEELEAAAEKFGTALEFAFDFAKGFVTTFIGSIRALAGAFKALGFNAEETGAFFGKLFGVVALVAGALLPLVTLAFRARGVFAGLGGQLKKLAPIVLGFVARLGALARALTLVATLLVPGGVIVRGIGILLGLLSGGLLVGNAFQDDTESVTEAITGVSTASQEATKSLEEYRREAELAALGNALFQKETNISTTAGPGGRRADILRQLPGAEEADTFVDPSAELRRELLETAPQATFATERLAEAFKQASESGRVFFDLLPPASREYDELVARLRQVREEIAEKESFGTREGAFGLRIPVFAEEIQRLAAEAEKIETALAAFDDQRALELANKRAEQLAKNFNKTRQRIDDIKASAQELARINGQGRDLEGRRLIALDNQYVAIERQFEVRQRDLQAQRAELLLLSQRLPVLLGGVALIDEELAAQKQLTLERLKQLDVEQERERLRLKRLQDAQEGGIFEQTQQGLGSYFDQLAQEAEDNPFFFQFGENLGQAAESNLANAIQNALLSGDVGSALEQFALSLGQAVLQELSSSLAKSLLSSVGGFFGGPAGPATSPVFGSLEPSPFGKAQGGPVGFDGGGKVPYDSPKTAKPLRGLDPRDRVLAALRPGEFVVRPEAVAGNLAFLENLNRTGNVSGALASRIQPVGLSGGGSVTMGASGGRSSAVSGRPMPSDTGAGREIYVITDDVYRKAQSGQTINDKLQLLAQANRP